MTRAAAMAIGSRPAPSTVRKPTRSYRIQSLVRGLEVLEQFGDAPRGMTLSEITSTLRHGKATTFRYLSTLAELGYLEFDPETRRYRPAVRALRLGTAYLTALSVPDLAAPILEKLSKTVGESVNMAVLDQADIIYVARIGTQRILSTSLSVGSRLPAHCTAMGKVLLAYLPLDQQEELLSHLKLKPVTPKTLTNLARLRDALRTVWQQGYALNDQELDPGLRSCAAPILDRRGAVLAAINVSVSSARVSLSELETQYVPPLRAAAQEINEILTSRY